ncbi:hypothetical protein [Roseibium litorale]|uniref:Uncharacterized protein n=1 Tax=Roseibium litorale TaxID=2803841 RepID=A0ABR9CK03_9HYPH|nr:hypothetical protein [Roseibium litorale]MBD8890740.1 hypothetical protein [Roseibium litorale]
MSPLAQYGSGQTLQQAFQTAPLTTGIFLVEFFLSPEAADPALWMFAIPAMERNAEKRDHDGTSPVNSISLIVLLFCGDIDPILRDVFQL